jgi:hypothetical protein
LDVEALLKPRIVLLDLVAEEFVAEEEREVRKEIE